MLSPSFDVYKPTYTPHIVRRTPRALSRLRARKSLHSLPTSIILPPPHTTQDSFPPLTLLFALTSRSPFLGFPRLPHLTVRPKPTSHQRTDRATIPHWPVCCDRQIDMDESFTYISTQFRRAIGPRNFAKLRCCCRPSPAPFPRSQRAGQCDDLSIRSPMRNLPHCRHRLSAALASACLALAAAGQQQQQ